MTQTNQTNFRPKARLLLLLGDQLIRNPGIAVFELTKNAYDADSPFVNIFMDKIDDRDEGCIVIEDAGTGMDYKTITEVWLEPGTDYRKNQRERGERTPIYNRLPLGEKGVGRFAVHKLGKKIRLITRSKDKPEILVDIDWGEFDQDEYLSNIPINITQRQPEIFNNGKTGTRIEISHLWQGWDRKMVRNLSRSINSICSPFVGKVDFFVNLNLQENQKWLDGLLSVKDILDYALFTANCKITERELVYSYEFRPYPSMREIAGRTYTYCEPIPKRFDSEIIDNEIGNFELDLFMFDREPAVLALGVADRKGFREYLNENGGIRVYRDNIRVFDYGEPENDWLNLDARRVNIPASRISNNVVLGAVSLNVEKSSGLIEKTNREGFIDNQASQLLKDVVVYVITQIEADRKKDKDRIHNVYGRTRAQKTSEPVIEELALLREEIKKAGLEKDVEVLINRIEADYILIRDRFLSSATTGLSLSVVIHEVEKGISELSRAVELEPVSKNIKELAKHLAELVEGFAALIRNTGKRLEKTSKLINNAVFNTQLRLKLHGIELEVDHNSNDFEIICSRRLIISTIMNLIDNSIWWLDNKWGETSGKKKLYIGTTKIINGNPTIIVADNGPGFLDNPEDLIEPFFSRKPEGMGLGLHLADQVMKAHGGNIEFPSKEVMNLPEDYDGAIVALVFKET